MPTPTPHRCARQNEVMPPEVPGLELGALIGSGGFAAVYRARQVSVDRDVAVKVDGRRLCDERDRRRFARETRTAGRISAHPNIVTIYDAGTTPDLQPYLVMEYCPGGSLADEMLRRGPLPESEVVPIGLAVADALTAAHDAGILHRDVKPANILLTEYGSPALADFGLAMLPREGETMSVTLAALTPSYAPPEAFEHAVPTPSADIWALGATVYALLRGRPPHWDEESGPPIGVLLGLLQNPLPPLDVPHTPQLMDVIWQATDPDPARRHGSAAHFRAALADAVVAEPYGASPAVAPTVPAASAHTAPLSSPTLLLTRPDARRRPWWPFLAVAFAAVVVGVVVAIATHRGSTGTLSPPRNGSPSQSSTRSSTTSTAAATGGPTRFVGFSTGRCYGDLIMTGGVHTARRVPCGGPHSWETFAVGRLDSSTNAPTVQQVASDPVVRSTCTTENLDRYLGGGPKPKHGPKPSKHDKGKHSADHHGPPTTYRIAVLGPDRAAFAAGAHGFGCLAAASGQQVSGSLHQ